MAKIICKKFSGLGAATMVAEVMKRVATTGTVAEFGQM